MLSTQIFPCIASTRRAEMVRPRPVPPNVRVLEPSACEKASKIIFCLSCGMPIPVSRTEKCRRNRSWFLGLNGYLQFHLALLGELDRIPQEVHQYLSDPRDVSDHTLRHFRRHTADQLHTFFVRPQR